MLLGGICAWLVAVAWSDWTRLRIPNRLLAPAALALAVAGLAGLHPAGLQPGAMLTGALVVLAIGVPCMALGLVGAGDVKLMAVLGGLFGAGESLVLLWAAASLLGALHIAVWWWLRRRRPALPLAPGARLAGSARRLPHGVHIAAAAAGLLLVHPRTAAPLLA